MAPENEIHVTTSRRDPFTVMVGEGQAVYFASGKSETVSAEVGQFIVDSGQVPDAELHKNEDYEDEPREDESHEFVP